jgi:hypothetical protein
MSKIPGNTATRNNKAPARSAAEPRLSRQRKPADLAVDDWQRALRRQFGREQKFGLENLGDDPVFSEFAVFNPESRRRYRVVDSRRTCRRQPLLVSRLCDQRSRYLQAHRIHAGADQRPTGRQDRARTRLPGIVQRTLSRLRRTAARPPASGQRFPAELQPAARRLFDPAAAAGNCRRSTLPICRRSSTSVRAAGHDLRCADDAWSFVAEVRDGELRRQALAAAYPLGADSPELQTLLKVALYPYQREGALFAARAGRALIGDEMGLGKTVQAIAAMEIFARHFAAERVLIVCPTSLKHQWEREIARFSERQRDGHRRPAQRPPGALCAGRLLQDHQLRNAEPRPRPDPGLGAGRGDRRRSTADQELEHHRRARAEARSTAPTPSCSPARRSKTGSRS